MSEFEWKSDHSESYVENNPDIKKLFKNKFGTVSVYDGGIKAYSHPQDFEEDHLRVLNAYLDSHNKLRKDPKSFIPYCEERLQYMKGDFYCYSTLKPAEDKPQVNIKTKEGITAINETIKFL